MPDETHWLTSETHCLAAEPHCLSSAPYWMTAERSCTPGERHCRPNVSTRMTSEVCGAAGGSSVTRMEGIGQDWEGTKKTKKGGVPLGTPPGKLLLAAGRGGGDGDRARRSGGRQTRGRHSRQLGAGA